MIKKYLAISALLITSCTSIPERTVEQRVNFIFDNYKRNDNWLFNLITNEKDYVQEKNIENLYKQLKSKGYSEEYGKFKNKFDINQDGRVSSVEYSPLEYKIKENILN